MNERAYSIGIDIGGTNTKFGVVDRYGNVTKQSSINTNAFLTVTPFIDALYTNIQPIIEAYGGTDQFYGIGIGAPNGNFYTGCIEYAPNLHWKGVIPLAESIQTLFQLPTKLTNDANAAAMGEMMYGCAKGVDHFIMITLGTGVGSGIVVDRKMVLGHDGFAGELGHTIIRPNGRLHKGTGMKGSLESYASASGVVETAIELLKNHPHIKSSLRTINEDLLTSKIIHECAQQGDEIAIQVFEYTGKILGEALSNFVLFSSPELIVLFGGLTKAGDLIMQPARFHLEENLLPIYKNKIKLVFSSLNESDAAIIGASALVFGI